MTDRIDVNVTIDPRGVTAAFQREANIITWIALASATGLARVRDGDAIDTPDTCVTIGDVGEMNSNVRVEAHSWLIGSAMEQIVEALARATDDFRRCCVIARRGKYHGVPLPTGASVPETLRDVVASLDGEKEADKYVDKPLTGKFEKLSADFRLNLSTPCEELRQVQQLRNCLTHRFGVVAERDVDPASGELRVVFRDVGIVATDAHGNRRRLDGIANPVQLEGPCSVSIEFGLPREQVLRVGGRVQLTTTDLISVGWMCLVACMELERLTRGYLSSAGLPRVPSVTPPSQ